MLIEHGARLDLHDDLLKSRPLDWACRWGRLEMAELLINRGALVEEPATQQQCRCRSSMSWFIRTVAAVAGTNLGVPMESRILCHEAASCGWSRTRSSRLPSFTGVKRDDATAPREAHIHFREGPVVRKVPVRSWTESAADARLPLQHCRTDGYVFDVR